MSDFNISLGGDNLSGANVNLLGGANSTRNITTNSNGLGIFSSDVTGTAIYFSGVTNLLQNNNSVSIPFNINYRDTIVFSGSTGTTYQLIISKNNDTSNVYNSPFVVHDKILPWYSQTTIYYSSYYNSFISCNNSVAFPICTETGFINWYSLQYKGVSHQGISFAEDSTNLYTLSGYKYNKSTGLITYGNQVPSNATDIVLGVNYAYITAYSSGLHIYRYPSFSGVTVWNTANTGATSTRVVCALSSDTAFVIMNNYPTRLMVVNGNNLVSGLTVAGLLSDIIIASDGYIYAGNLTNLYKIDPNSVSITSTLTVRGTTKITECNGKLLTIGGSGWDIVSISTFTTLSSGSTYNPSTVWMDSVAIGTKCYAITSPISNIKVFDMINNTLSSNNNLIGFTPTKISADPINNRVAVYTSNITAIPLAIYPVKIYNCSNLT